jgi:hypothetical protein
MLNKNAVPVFLGQHKNKNGIWVYILVIFL